MKHVKIISLVAVAAMALMAFAASSASATALYNGTTKLGVGSELDFSLKAGTKAQLTETAKSTGEGEGRVLDECGTSTVKGKITNAGGFDPAEGEKPATSTEVQGSNSELTWGSCSVPTTTDTLGGLKVAQIGTSTEGTVKANAEIGVTINTFFFGVCRYGVANGTHLGVIKSNSSTTAEFTANAVAVKQTGGEFACPSTTKWVATYVSTTPDNLRVEKE
jgi:hypothetical protein